MMRNEHYTYGIVWSAEDGEYVATCAEFTSLSWLADSPEAALAGIRKLVTDVVAGMQESDDAEHDFSGARRVQDVPDLAKLQAKAKEGKVSITLYVDADVIEKFEQMAVEEGTGYQALMNKVLRDAI